ncbi:MULTISPECIES: hypothetical protein [Shouchella]|uniref:Uncharacterized protein n=2 Tax=Shouchella TaxID=2893057 RepID=A0ABY7W6T4_9BACI|nr:MULTISPECIES: hypothetical protein [Shouchella]MED4130620.1 hypothetical protein [Shouchella miscanthi]WDF03329.1 hypothetical protein PQ477_17820 [Shouchella hunanensis]
MLWIMAQDKERISHVIEVSISGKKIMGVGSAGLNEWGNLLGKYDSKERAMEVLEDIHRTIANSSQFAITYTMPTD